MHYILQHVGTERILKASGGYTPLDRAYFNDDSPIQQEIIALIRSKGGKANCHDENGRWVEAGNGDLNH